MFERVPSKGLTVKLSSYHCKRVANICEYILYLNISQKAALADDPTVWDTSDFNMWKHKGKPTSNVPVTTTTTPPVATGTTTTTVTSAADKQQKIDNDKLQSWRHRKARKDGYPLLENDEFDTE